MTRRREIDADAVCSRLPGVGVIIVVIVTQHAAYEGPTRSGCNAPNTPRSATNTKCLVGSGLIAFDAVIANRNGAISTNGVAGNHQEIGVGSL